MPASKGSRTSYSCRARLLLARGRTASLALVAMAGESISVLRPAPYGRQPRAGVARPTPAVGIQKGQRGGAVGLDLHPSRSVGGRRLPAKGRRPILGTSERRNVSAVGA